MARRKTVTLKMIADELSLTIHTVSKALRGLPGMSETTRRLVVNQARELGYRTKEQEAGMSAERIPWVNTKPRRFAMLMSGDLPFHQQQLEGMQIRMNELGQTLHTLLIPRILSSESDLEDWLEMNGVLYTDGLFLTAALPEWMETALLKLPLPKVLINYPPDVAEVDSVVWDVEYAVHRSMQVLYNNGHRRILYVGEIGSLRGFQLRWKAFMAATEQLGLEHSSDPEEHVTGNPADRARWMEVLRDRLSTRQFTAVISTVPSMSEWVHAAASSLNLEIPVHISLIGMEHEENPYFPHMSRPVLLVREAGERAAELMLRRIANPMQPYEAVRLKGRFLEGQTIRTI